jgi:hypothetical protein
MIRPPGLGSGLEPYLTKCCLTAEVKEDIQWWQTYLQHKGGRFARSVCSATLIPMWGDGSGTGTGGTFEFPGGPLRMWKGKWTPAVFHFSSNWKELSTLKLSLLQTRDEDITAVHGTTVFSSGSPASPPFKS